VEIIHDNDEFYYVGQTGDNRDTTARPAFRRLAGHMEDLGTSTQNQIYRFLAVDVLNFSEARQKKRFDDEVKQAVEDFLANSTVKMYVYHLQPFQPGIEHVQHLAVVRKVTNFERMVIDLLSINSKKIANKKLKKIKKTTACPYPDALDQIIADFKLRPF
jgi:hypothetical protein